MADSFSSFERLYVGPFRIAFARVTGPLVKLLVLLKVSPNVVSTSQIAIGVIIVVILAEHPRTAFLLFLSTLVLDGIDGALARAYGRTSDFGALVDQLSDHVRETLMIAGFAFHGALNPIAAVLYPLVYALCNFLLYVCNHKGAPIPWALKSYMVVYPAFFFYAFLGRDFMTPAVVLSITLMTITILLGMRNLRRVLD